MFIELFFREFLNEELFWALKIYCQCSDSALITLMKHGQKTGNDYPEDKPLPNLWWRA